MPEAWVASYGRGASATVFTVFEYAARSWQDIARRLVADAEVVGLDDRSARPNPHFGLTDLRHRAERVYASYCGRSEIENRFKGLNHDVALYGTRCHVLAAVQPHRLLTAAAFALVQILRRPLLERLRIQPLRLWLLKIGVHVECSVRRVAVHPTHIHSSRDLWHRTVIALGTAST